MRHLIGHGANTASSHKKTDTGQRQARVKTQGSIRDSQAWSGTGGCEAGSWRWMPAERDEMEPTRTAVEMLGGDAAEASREALDPAVAAGDRLDVQGVRGDHRRQRPLHAVHVEFRQSAAEGRAAREASPSGGSDRTAATLRHAPPSIHRCSKTSPETAPDPLLRSPWSMQVETQCSTCACKVRTEPSIKHKWMTWRKRRTRVQELCFKAQVRIKHARSPNSQI